MDRYHHIIKYIINHSVVTTNKALDNCFTLFWNSAVHISSPVWRIEPAMSVDLLNYSAINSMIFTLTTDYMEFSFMNQINKRKYSFF